jgi:hypothetical protein
MALQRTPEQGRCYDAIFDNAYTNTQSGFYVQAIYQFMPHWRVGYRFDQLYGGNSSYGFSADTLSGTALVTRTGA